jgi:hypothetical protein
VTNRRRNNHVLDTKGGPAMMVMPVYSIGWGEPLKNDGQKKARKEMLP